MPTTTGSLKSEWDRTLNDILFDEYQRYEPIAPKFFNVSTETKKHYIKKAAVIGLGQAYVVNEGSVVPNDDLYDGPSKQVFFDKIGLGLQVTELAIEDDENNILKDCAGTVAKAMAYTREVRTWDVLNSGFTTARLSLDGKKLFDTHTLLGPQGGTYSNVISGALSKTTLQSAFQQADVMVNERGLLIPPPQSWILLVAPNSGNQWVAEELVKSQFDPNSANNAVNSLLRKQISYAVVPFLNVAPNAWFLLPADKKDHDLHLINRTLLKPSQNTDYNTDNYMWKATQRYVATFWDWRGVFGSTGT